MWLGLALFRRETRLPDEELSSDAEALTHLEAATRLLPTSADAHQALGLCLLSTPQSLSASDELTKALQLDQSLFDARLTLTSLMARNSLTEDEAVVNFRLLMDGNPSYPPLLKALMLKEKPAASPNLGGGMAAVVTDRTLDEAFAAAREDGKPVMAIFSAPSWNSWSVKLDKETLTNARVKEQLKGFHVVFVDYDLEKDLDSQYQISGVPTTLIFDSTGNKVGDIVGYQTPLRFLREIPKSLRASGPSAVPRYVGAAFPPSGGAVAGAPPSTQPPAAEAMKPTEKEEEGVDNFAYFRRAKEWRDNGMFRPAIEEYRRWLAILLSSGQFEQVSEGATEMAEAYREAGFPAMEAYALYLPVEPRNVDEWSKVTAYVGQNGEDFGAALKQSLGLPLTPDRQAWLMYMKGVVEMATVFPAPGWREAVISFRSAEKMEFWPRRGDALIQMGNCYLALKRPYLAENSFEMALKAYQAEAKRLNLLGPAIAPWEADRLVTRMINSAKYVNLARDQDGKPPKYDVSEVAMGAITRLGAGFTPVAGRLSMLAVAPGVLLQFLQTAGAGTAATVGAAPSATADATARARALTGSFADYLGFFYQTTIGEQDRAKIAAELASYPMSGDSEKRMCEFACIMRQSLQSFTSLPQSELISLRRSARLELSSALAKAPAQSGFPVMLNLMRRLEAAASPPKQAG
jgi:tetratricopeptide (TPR) repeat protein